MTLYIVKTNIILNVGMLSKILVKDLPRNIKRITVFFPVTGHSFLPADRIFGRLEKKFRRMECITSPFDYINAFNEVATVSN